MSARAIVITAATTIVLASALLAAGYYLGHRTATPAAENISAAPAERQADGSVIVERAPVATASAPHQIPRGAIVERQVSVTVAPRAVQTPAQPDGSAPAVQGGCECKPVTVDLSLVRQQGGRRVIASSPDGDIISALDIPIDAAAMPEPARPWGVGLSCALGDSCALRTAGVIIQRDIARVRIGAELHRQADGKPAARVHAIWRF
ncbi:MAG: hypothetical protein CGU29_15775 [Candidatus Dactylopiibacterium carminicum]|uniref:Uncharacterized protein n=1 Tax=Candidatus Dactylopiibacterium carminicum TaxID=857335 RepID=A0A272EN41_9RHOO|nr:hypothetical protein [Candidatus Dactylopiibacterium carminicum]KAF7597973.1 hypothetical protein BGI27_15855 [Candidatus Dactylopiibacterium carminicum]PAS91548.1 MAG: hypothetical protein CGU29_15775 [Candidatus Dactylopiibacterium carminicum]PAS96158.1 MAG: hypothetical protein BSR46_15885 [Candidatus Dactylopiibacterium carminicum]